MPSYTVELSVAEAKLVEQLAETWDYPQKGGPCGLNGFLEVLVQLGMVEVARINKVLLPDTEHTAVDDGIPF